MTELSNVCGSCGHEERHHAGGNCGCYGFVDTEEAEPS